MNCFIFGSFEDLLDFIGADLCIQRCALQVLESRHAGFARSGQIPNRIAGHGRRIQAVQFREQARFIRIIFTIEPEITRPADGDAGRVRSVKSLWQLFAEDYTDGGILSRTAIVEVTANPPFGQVLLSIRGGLPDLRRPEMGAVWIRITDTLNDGQISALIEGF